MNSKQHTPTFKELKTANNSMVEAMLADLEGQSLFRSTWSQHFIAQGKPADFWSQHFIAQGKPVGET